MSPWVRNVIAVASLAVWCAYIIASLVRRDVIDFYIWGIPVALLTALPARAEQRPTQQPPQRDAPREDTT